MFTAKPLIQLLVKNISCKLVLEDRDIIQIDATVITGVLILLTVSSLATESSANQNLTSTSVIDPLISPFSGKFIIATAIILPFTTSAMLAGLTSLFENLPHNRWSTKRIEMVMGLSKLLMIGGFGYLLIALFWLLYTGYFK